MLSTDVWPGLEVEGLEDRWKWASVKREEGKE